MTTESVRFGYFVLQARAETGQDGIHVLLEDLGTGEKLTFDSVEELEAYFDKWRRGAEQANSGAEALRLDIRVT